jgi:anti-sigma regulatory factor (Ser/Thr protein kinase)
MTSFSIRVDGPDQAGEARRAAASLARSTGLDETTAGRLAIVVTECANNLWKHGGGGEILLTPTGSGGPGVEVLALDRGPGMPDIERCFQDGYSTAGSSGTGLGAVRRLSTAFDVYTVPGKGTALLARLGKGGGESGREISGVSVPMKGETLCGDDFVFSFGGKGCATILVVDGLGHGPLAADCAAAATETFRERETDSPPELLRDVHGALRTTRGAAVAIGHFDWAGGQLQYCGIGNIAGMLWANGQTRHLLSHPGIVGHDLRNVRDVTYPLSENVLCLLYSDGISTHWSLDAYPGLPSRDPALIAGIVYRDHKRGRDDATVVVARGRVVPV